MAFPGTDDNTVFIVIHFSVGSCSWCRRMDLPREERKHMLSPGLGKKIECVGV